LKCGIHGFLTHTIKKRQHGVNSLSRKAPVEVVQERTLGPDPQSFLKIMAEEKLKDLEWRESSPGVFSRSLDATEKHFIGMRDMYARHGKECSRMSMIVKIDFPGPDFVAVTQQAWKWIRHRHPILASKISTENMRVYRVGDAEEITEWIAETFIVHDGGQTAQDFLGIVGPLPRAAVHVFPASKELVFYVSHHLCDAHSLIRLTEYLLELLESPPGEVIYGDEVKNLPRPIKLAAHIPDASPAQITRTQSGIGNWASSYPSVGLGAKDIYAVPGITRLKRIELSLEESNKVIAAAKAKGFSLTHVIEAAAIVAVKKMDASGEDRQFCSCGLFSLRESCGPEDAEASIPHVTFIPYAVTPASLTDTAQQLKAYYNGWRSDMDDLLAMIEPTLATFAMMQSMPNLPPNEMVSISSFGRFEPRLESVHGAVKLEDIGFIYETPYPGIVSAFWSRGGRIMWQVCYNERHYDEERIKAWLKFGKESLFEGLGVVPDV
jgi:hypothetical protein